MKKNYTHQEILLFTKARYLSREWNKKEDNVSAKKLSAREKLEEACWNGLVNELLPEISEQKRDTSVSLWKINAGNSFLDLRFAKLPVMIEDESSLNPYVFMEYQEYN